eukprot:5613386-Lingulodinium_polyedra.AAC.1
MPIGPRHMRPRALKEHFSFTTQPLRRGRRPQCRATRVDGKGHPLPGGAGGLASPLSGRCRRG